MTDGAYSKITNFSFTTNTWTISAWFKKISSVTDSFETICGLSRNNGTDANKKFSLYIKNTAVGFVGEGIAHSNITTIDNTLWHHVCVTNNGSLIKYYLDGVLINTYDNSNNLTDCTDFVVGARASATGADTIATPWGGYISDVRLYCTSLLDSEVKKLYNISMGIDKLGNSHNNEFMQDNTIQINKNGVTCGDIIEIPRLLYDNNIYVEPDGSLWVHLFHHNAPATNGYFTDITDEQFEHSIYLNKHKWFNMEVCNYVNKWEILTVRRYSSENDFVRNRWI